MVQENFLLERREQYNFFARTFFNCENILVFLKPSGVDQFVGAKIWVNHREGYHRKDIKNFSYHREISSGWPFRSFRKILVSEKFTHRKGGSRAFRARCNSHRYPNLGKDSHAM